MRTFLIALPLLAVAAPAAAFEPDHHREKMERAFDEVDATNEQRSAITELFEVTLPELRSLKEEGHELRKEFRSAFLEETVDRGAIEVLRWDALELADRTSSVVLDLVVEAANVLSVDQRVTLQTMHDRMHEMHRGHRRGE